MTRPSIARDEDNCRSIDALAALHVEAAAEVLGDHAVPDKPARVGAPMALKLDDRRTVGRDPVSDINAPACAR